MKQKLITITTDFGDQFSVSQLHTILAGLGYNGKLIENHSVTPFSILEGAFELMVTASFSPTKTIHVAVVDPGVGSNRRGVVVKTKHSWFVGPDNGLLYPAAKNEGIIKAWQLNETHFGDHISNTFHGRDVFIKVATSLAQGKQPISFGSSAIPVESLTPLVFKNGQVLHIDHYGNIKIHRTGQIGTKKICIITTKGGTFTAPFVKTFSDVPLFKPLALLGSTGTLELAVNQKRGDRFFSVSVGDIVHIQ